MPTLKIELAPIDLPDFGLPTVQPHIEKAEYEARLQSFWHRATERNLDIVCVYGDREHAANLAFLTGYDPRFEEALLILNGHDTPLLLVGNEGWGYAAISPLILECRLYQPFSLMGQDRSKSIPLAQMLGEAGIGPGSRVGLIDWKYFEAEAGAQPQLWLNAPAYLVDTLRQLTGQPVLNITDLLMNPRDGLRVINSVDQLACLEFAATHSSTALRRILFNLRPGQTEFEAMELARLNGFPLSCHPMLSSGPRAWLGLPSPSSRLLQLGDPVTCAIGLWGGLNARAGFLVHQPAELPADIQDYVERLVKPYFTAIVAWYQHLGLGVTGGELYDLIQQYLGNPFFGVGLNPGHFIHLDEWVHSPIAANSQLELRSGMALQVDVIPATGGAYFTTNIEDGVALADESLRQSLATRWPTAWARIQARRNFMQNSLGIQLKPEVLPFSNLAAYLPPYLLSPHQAMRVSHSA